MNRLLFPALLAATALLLTACPQTPPPPPPSACTPTATGLSVQGDQTEPATQSYGLGDFTAPHVPGELLVLPGGLSPQSLGSRVSGIQVQASLPGGFLHVKVPVGLERIKADELLRAGARYVQPNYLYRPLRVPNDPRYGDIQRPYLRLVGLEAAWHVYTGDPSLTMAVVDTGYRNHEDMQFPGRWYLPQGQTLDLADDDSDPWDDTPDAIGSTNPFSHGLAVASVLGADTNNQLGMAGVTWVGKVLPLKVARTSDGRITTDTVAKAVQKAVELGAKVVNLSLGAPTYDPALENALVIARNQGVVLVGAAGNEGIDGVLYPARSAAVIAVGSVSVNLTKSSFSNCGPELDLVAPGEKILVLLPNNGYGKGSGTSFASPIVAGVAALYMGKYHQDRNVWPSPDQVYQCLVGTAQDLGPAGHDTGYGFGLVRADRVMTDTTYCFP